MNAQVFLEWFHRLDAFLVGLALLTLLAASVWRRRELPTWLPWVALLSVILVAVQAGLGALTVTHLLASPMVTAHLATALLLVVLISALDQCLLADPPPRPRPLWSWLLPIVPTTLVLAQCVLGGVMASQWSVDHCFTSGTQCEWVFRHRQFAVPAALCVVAMAGITFISPWADGLFRGLASAAATLVGAQLVLGLLTLRLQLQVPAITIAHQLLATLLVAILGALCGRSFPSGMRRAVIPSLEVSCG
jgi:cytochrome c oxidase assembly protein subunit 15